MLEKIRVLYICTGNSCRSQMAEGYARMLGKQQFDVRSAGIEAHGKNPRAVAVMAEDGLDISSQESTRLTPDLIQWADWVVTVCGHADQHCGPLPDHTRRVHWPLPDPAQAEGTEEEILSRFREVRDEVRERVTAQLESLSTQSPT